MATPKKKPVVDGVQGVEVAAPSGDITVVFDGVQGVEVAAPSGDITVVFDGEGNKTVGYCLNGQGATFSAGEPVKVPQYVADLIGKYQIV